MSYALLCVATVAYLARRARRARVRCVLAASLVVYLAGVL